MFASPWSLLKLSYVLNCYSSISVSNYLNLKLNFLSYASGLFPLTDNLKLNYKRSQVPNIMMRKYDKMLGTPKVNPV